MAVAKVVQTVCDLCGSEKDAEPVQVTRGAAWEIDMCAKCYKSRFGDLEKMGHKPARRRRRSFEIVEPL